MGEEPLATARREVWDQPRYEVHRAGNGLKAWLIWSFQASAWVVNLKSWVLVLILPSGSSKVFIKS